MKHDGERESGSKRGAIAWSDEGVLKMCEHPGCTCAIRIFAQLDFGCLEVTGADRSNAGDVDVIIRNHHRASFAARFKFDDPERAKQLGRALVDALDALEHADVPGAVPEADPDDVRGFIMGNLRVIARYSQRGARVFLGDDLDDEPAVLFEIADTVRGLALFASLQKAIGALVAEARTATFGLPRSDEPAGVESAGRTTTQEKPS